MNPKMKQGTLDLMLLAILAKEELYGLEILKAVEIQSEGTFTFKEGSLYPALHRLVKDASIEAYWQESTTGGAPRKYYRVTEHGKKVLEQKKADWTILRNAIDAIVMKGAM